MSNLINDLLIAVESGKTEKNAPYPPHMRGINGASEITQEALKQGISPKDILSKALIPAMDIVGQKFSENKIFILEREKIKIIIIFF